MTPLDPERIKIPAFQRKREIDRKARKTIAWTAFDRQRVALEKEQKKVNHYVAPDISPTKKSPPKRFPLPLTSPSASSAVLKSPVFEAPVVPSIQNSRFQIVGTVTHYIERIQVAIIALTSVLRKDQLIAFEDENGIFFQKVASMQIDRKDVKMAKKGAEIGLKMEHLPKVGGKVYVAK